MKKKRAGNTKKNIVSTAWKLFHEQGYDDTTVDDIVFESGTSKGSFYHYFKGKDDLLSTLSDLFDDKYEELKGTFPEGMKTVDKLLYLNKELFHLIEESVPTDLLASLLSSQLTTHGEKHLLDRNRVYYRLLRGIFMDGQEKGELTKTLTASEMMKTYAMMERALMYDWCLSSGEYSLTAYSERILPLVLNGLIKKEE